MLAEIYLRVADTLERSAALAELHAQRSRAQGNQQRLAIELQRAERARIAADRGRALAARLGTRDPYLRDETPAAG